MRKRRQERLVEVVPRTLGRLGLSVTLHHKVTGYFTQTVQALDKKKHFIRKGARKVACFLPHHQSQIFVGCERRFRGVVVGEVADEVDAVADAVESLCVGAHSVEASALEDGSVSADEETALRFSE